MTWILLLALARVDVASLAGPCDERELKQVFRERLEALAPPEHGDSVVSLRFHGGTYAVEIARPGHAPLLRPLAAGDDCELVAEMAALVVERYLRALPPPEPAQPEPAQAEPKPEPQPDPGIAAAPPPPAHDAAPPVAEPEPPRFSFSAGGAGLLTRGGAWQPGFEVQLAWRTESWSLGLALATAADSGPEMMRPAWPGPRFRPAEIQPTTLAAASVSRCLGDWLRTCAGPYLGARWTGAEAQPEVGGSLGVDLALSAHLRFGLSLLGGTSPIGPSLTAAASLGLLVF